MESSEFVIHLQPFLHDQTEHFVHELISFAKSPLDMIAYDAKVSYDIQHLGASATSTGNSGGDARNDVAQAVDDLGSSQAGMQPVVS